jgi:cell division septation protein DedD
MKNFNKIKNKYTMELDERQILYLFITIAAAMIASFVIGIYVGKTSLLSPESGPKSGNIGSDHHARRAKKGRLKSRPTPRPENNEDELVDGAANQDDLDSSTEADQAESEVEIAQAGEDNPEWSESPEPVVTPRSRRRSPLPPAESESLLKRNQLNDLNSPPSLIPLPEPALEIEDFEDHEADNPIQKQIQEIYEAKVRQPSADTNSAEKKVTKPVTLPEAGPRPIKMNGKKMYTVQVGAFQNKEDARQLLERLRQKGLSAYMISTDIPGKGTWHRVRVGTFDDKDGAKAFAEAIETNEPISTFVTVYQQ